MVHYEVSESSLFQPESVLEAFREIVSRYGDSIAVESHEGSLTYTELESRSDALAEKLISEGVQVGDRVGLACERRPELIVALLAILKAGGVYLPLDPSYPSRRLEFMARDAGLKLILGSAEFGNFEGIRTISFSEFPIEETHASQPSLSGESPAYLLYTSGSTGEPKGVLVPHRAILRLVLDNHFAKLGPETRVLQHSPIAFDASTFEIWGPLLNGGRLILLPEGPLTLRSLGEAIFENEINTLWLTAGLFHAMVDERLGDFGGLTQLLAGGDVISPSRARKVLEKFPDLRLINGYGPTENTTFTCCHEITLAETKTGSPIPIGRPIEGTGVYLLDNDRQLVAPGEIGELCASGPGLALGYWNRDELTEERFVSAPWDETVRLYRTGDLATQDEDGVFHFEGRRDQQIKIRGFRLELSEIESALESQSSITQAVVTADTREDEADKILNAWVVSTA
ncbi:MAG: amino acid adenylation domain-containing protein, partial [Verrucomicrobiota bacterium]